MNNMIKVCIVLVVIAGIAIYFFKVPMNSILFYGGILLCPLMHIFMMNHGNHSDKSSDDHSKHQ